NTLSFNPGDSVFETEIFEEKSRIVGTPEVKELAENKFTLTKIPEPFEITGSYQFLERANRKATTKYIKAVSDITIKHRILGEFKLPAGKSYLIIDRYLSPLRIANKGYPLRSVPNKEETWNEFLEKLV
ncbi:hypothetical protein KKC59_01460, partial [bacterium]|nr:hypothetical protein [bacterium]